MALASRPGPHTHMLRLSKKTDYALIALTYMAAIGNKPSSAREIAERHDVPVELLAKVLQRLVQKGVLKSHQGIHGGYVLARPSDTVTVAEIVEAIDGPLVLTVCGTTEDRCEQFSKCNIRDPLQRIRDRIIGTLMACTIAELASVRTEDPIAMPIATGDLAIAGRSGSAAGRRS
jgi:Rrf2 family protein